MLNFGRRTVKCTPNRGVFRGSCTWTHRDLEELGGEGRVEGHFDAAGAKVDLALHRRRPTVSSQLAVGKTLLDDDFGEQEQERDQGDHHHHEHGDAA